VEAVIPAGTTLQHSSLEQYRGQPLYFGANAKHRFDDPDRKYGVFYVAFNLATVLMESVFHEHRWWEEMEARVIMNAEVQRRMVRVISVVTDLTLCDLASPSAAAKAFGWTAARLVVRNGPRTRALSAQIARLKTKAGSTFDGILYLSRNNPGDKCIALFDRAASKIRVMDDIRLDDHRDWPAFVSQYGISIAAR
jgi:hypothetical protein